MDRVEASAAHIYQYGVIGGIDQALGSVEGIWLNDTTGQLEFIGIKTGVISQAMHLAPAGSGEIDEGTRTVRLPYSLDKVMGAPTFDLHAVLSDEDRQRIYSYYGLVREPQREITPGE